MIKTFDRLLNESLAGKVVLVRVDFNAPIANGKVTDNTRLRASLGTIQALTSQGARVVLVSHLDRPKGKVVEALRLTPIQHDLSVLLGKPVLKVDTCIGDSVKQAIASLNNSDVLLLENIRFHKEEEINDETFAKTLASYCDYFVQDAFGAVHRAHASTHAVAKFLPAYSGMLLDKELRYLSQLMQSPQRPFTAIVGGSKISTKLTVLQHLLDVVDTLVVGGAMVYTLLKASGQHVGRSLVEDDLIPTAQAFLQDVQTKGKRLYIPEDHVVVSDINQPDTAETVDQVLSHQIGVDIGPVSIQKISQIIQESQLIFWNGPVGIFEVSAYSNGTMAIAKALAEAAATTVVGGGDSIAALNVSGYADAIDHISTGGGASLAFLEGKPLPGIEVLS